MQSPVRLAGLGTTSFTEMTALAQAHNGSGPAPPVERAMDEIPTAVFYDDKLAGSTLVRFAFCKRPEVIAEAVARLSSSAAASRR